MHNILFLSSESQRVQEAFVIQTIAASKGNKTGQKLISELCSSYNDENYKYTTPYLVLVDGQTGKTKDCAPTEKLERNISKWKGHHLDKVIGRLFGAGEL